MFLFNSNLCTPSEGDYDGNKQSTKLHWFVVFKVGFIFECAMAAKQFETCTYLLIIDQHSGATHTRGAARFNYRLESGTDVLVAKVPDQFESLWRPRLVRFVEGRLLQRCVIGCHWNCEMRSE